MAWYTRMLANLGRDNLIEEHDREAVLRRWPSACSSFFAPTGAWRVYPDHSEKSLPIAIAMDIATAWAAAAHEAALRDANDEYASQRKSGI